jgi:hypothetical protein
LARRSKDNPAAGSADDNMTCHSRYSHPNDKPRLKLQARLNALVVCILRPEQRHAARCGCQYPPRSLKPKSGFHLHAAKVTSLACDGPAQMKSFYLIRFSPTACMIGSNRSAGDI